MIRAILSSLVGGTIKGALKAHASGAVASATGIVMGPGVDGFMRGLGGSLEEAGFMVGTAVGTYVLAFVATWLPANRPVK